MSNAEFQGCDSGIKKDETWGLNCKLRNSNCEIGVARLEIGDCEIGDWRLEQLVSRTFDSVMETSF